MGFVQPIMLSIQTDLMNSICCVHNYVCFFVFFVSQGGVAEVDFVVPVVVVEESDDMKVRLE